MKTTKTTWEAKLLDKFPAATISYVPANCGYVATINDKEVGRFSYGNIKSGKSLISGTGWIDRLR